MENVNLNYDSPAVEVLEIQTEQLFSISGAGENFEEYNPLG